MTVAPIYNLGDFGTNCYILSDGGHAALVDAPFSADVISRRLDSLGLEPEKILMTHGHCDHIEALNGLVKKYGCEVYISDEDLPMLTDSGLCLADYFGAPFEPFYGAKTFSDGDVIILGGADIRVMSTAGHTLGSVSFIADEFIFTGDTLFEGTVGRTDLGGGSFEQLIRSIEKIMKTQKNRIVYAGHGAPTDLRTELRFNPYLRELCDSLGENFIK